MKTKLKINRIFINILISYIVVLLVPLTFIGIIYNVAGNAIRQNIIETNQALLTQSMMAIEDKFNNMRRVMMSFSRQRNLMDYVMTESVDISFIAKSIDLRDQINTIQSTDDMIDKIYIYSNHNTKFYSASGLADIGKFAESSYQNEAINVVNLPALLADSHMGRFLPLAKITQPATLTDQVSSSNQMVTKDQITFIQTLPVALSKQYDGAVIVLLSASSITQMLNSGLLADGSVAIVDESGKKLVEITGSSAQKGSLYTISFQDVLTGDYDSNGVIVTKVVSPTTKWTYLASVSEQSVLATLNGVGRVVLLLSLTMGLVGLALIFYLSRYNALPFTKISQIMYGLYDDSGAHGRGGQYGNFVEAITRLVASNRELSSALSEQNDLLTYSFFNRLLSGGFESNHEIYAFLSRLKLNFDGMGYMVVHIRFFSPGEQGGIQMVGAFNEAYAVVENAARNLLHGNVSLHKQDIGNVFLIYNPYYQKEDAERNALISDSMAILFNQLLANLNVNFHMAVGGYYDNIQDVSMSAKEAQRALAAYELNKSQPILAWYDDRQNKDSGQHPYSLVFEQHLLNQIAIGNRGKVVELLEGFYTSNIIKRKLTYKTLDIIKHELVSTLIRAMQESGYQSVGSNALDEISFDDPIDVFYAKITAAAAMLCEGGAAPPDDAGAPLADLLIGYVRKNLSDADLNYVKICDHFNISRYHLNKYILEKTGAGFTDFLEGLRMERAVKLLEESELSIHDIALKTGYLNDKTFRRAFKRSFGYAPSDRRLRDRIAQGLQ